MSQQPRTIFVAVELFPLEMQFLSPAVFFLLIKILLLATQYEKPWMDVVSQYVLKVLDSLANLFAIVAYPAGRKALTKKVRSNYVWI